MIFRDPREVIVSEYRMRTTVYHKTQRRYASLDKFVKFKFKVRLATVSVWTDNVYG